MIILTSSELPFLRGSELAEAELSALRSLRSLSKIPGLGLPWSFQFSLQRAFPWDSGIRPELQSRGVVLQVWSNSISNVWNLLEMQILWLHLLGQKLWDCGPAIGV